MLSEETIGMKGSARYHKTRRSQWTVRDTEGFHLEYIIPSKLTNELRQFWRVNLLGGTRMRLLTCNA